MSACNNRIGAAVFLAPLAALVPILIVASLSPVVGWPNVYEPREWMAIGVFALPFAFAATLAVGLPAYLVLRLLDLGTADDLAMAGLLAGCVPIFTNFPISARGEDTVFLFLYPACAAAVGYAFGYLVNAVPE